MVKLSHDEIIEKLLIALDNSSSLLTAMLMEKRPDKEIEDQIIENRAALNFAAGGYSD
jgi:hypothetical protein